MIIKLLLSKIKYPASSTITPVKILIHAKPKFWTLCILKEKQRLRKKFNNKSNYRKNLQSISSAKLMFWHN